MSYPINSSPAERNTVLPSSRSVATQPALFGVPDPNPPVARFVRRQLKASASRPLEAPRAPGAQRLNGASLRNATRKTKNASMMTSWVQRPALRRLKAPQYPSLRSGNISGMSLRGPDGLRSGIVCRGLFGRIDGRSAAARNRVAMLNPYIATITRS